jgi:hypothetical protein
MTPKVKGSFFAFLDLAIPGLLVLLFSYAGFNKLFALKDFTETLYNQPVPHLLAPVLAWLFPCLEILAAGLLLFPQTRRMGLFLSLGLLVIFSAYVSAILLHFFRRVPCNCGGLLRTLSWQQHFWVNAGFLVLTVLALCRNLLFHS